MKDNKTSLSITPLASKIKKNAKLINGLNMKTLFQRILEEHKQILFVKNYTEQMIGSTTENGYFLQELEAAFGQAIQKHLWIEEIARINLTMIGHFAAPNETASPSSNTRAPQDKIHFEFTYAYDPASPSLKLTAMKATLNEEFEKEYPMVNHPSKDLPTAVAVHRELDRKRTQHILQKAIQSKPAKKLKRKTH